MKKFLFFLASTVLLTSCGDKSPQSNTEIINGDMPYCESTLFHKGKMIVPSFGPVSEFNSLNTEGKGYIVEFTGKKSRVLFPNDGLLSAPKGTIVKDNHLFVCDVTHLVIYNLEDVSAEPQVIVFPAGELMLNDFAIKGNTLYTTVTNTGNIYTLDISNPSEVDPTSLQFYTNVVGANGILIDGNTMYIASFPPDMNVTEDNVIYKIEDMDNPTITKLITRGDMYDGMVLDGGKLYYSCWGITGDKGEIGYIDLNTGDMHILDLGIELAGPGRFCMHEGKLYIPDMPNSRIVVYKL